MSTPLQKALDSMTRYSALKQPPLSTAQGGSTSPFSKFRHPAKTAPLPCKNALPQKRTPGIPSAGNPANRDSINAKVLGGERGTFLQKGPPSPLQTSPFLFKDFCKWGRSRLRFLDSLCVGVSFPAIFSWERSSFLQDIVFYNFVYFAIYKNDIMNFFFIGIDILKQFFIPT